MAFVPQRHLPASCAAAAVLCLAAAPLLAQTPLEIVSPRAGTQFHPGDTITVTVRTSKTYKYVGIIPGAPLRSSQILEAAPYVFSVELPANLDAGKYYMTAIGAPGGPGSDGFDSSDMLGIDVEPIWPSSADGSRQVTDAPGVTVDTGGIPLRHRSAISYPAALIAQGIEGTVVAQVTPDWNGHLRGVHVLSGPVELAKHVVLSVRRWHYADGVGDTKPRPISINFNVADARRAPAAAARNGSIAENIPYAFWVYTPNRSRRFILEKLTIFGISQDLTSAIMAFLGKLHIHEGEEISFEQLYLLRGNAGRVDDDLYTWLQMTGNRVRATVSPIGFFPSERDDPPPLKTARYQPGVNPTRITVSSVDQAARLISGVDPVYPLGASLNFIQGVVCVHLMIGPDGHVIEAHASGPEELRQAAEDAAKQWVYSPATRNGRAVEVDSEAYLDFFLPY